MDTRDNKLYWVTKLKDGNCWMTQNLDYDIPASGITGDQAAKTDLSDGTVWDSSSDYAPQPTSTDINVMRNDSDTGTYSWDPGMYVKTTPTDHTEACFAASGYDDPECTDAGWTDVSSMTAMTEERADGVVTSGNTYDAHYLVGNFYQWNAATAGSGGTITSTEVTDSICPKGWELPTLRGDSSFGSLLSQYSSDDTSNIITDFNPEQITGTINDGRIATSPLYLQYSGHPNTGGVLANAGYEGFYWSSTAYSDSSKAFRFNFRTARINSSGSVADRYYGYPIRCLAPSA